MGLDEQLGRIAGLKPAATPRTDGESRPAPAAPPTGAPAIPPVTVSRFPVAHQHGRFPLQALLDDAPDALAPVTVDLGFQDVPVREIAFFDTETSGLSGGAGCRVFLVGLGYFRDDVFIVEQHLLTGFDRELEFLERVRARFACFRGVATFFGKSFDRPRLEDRYAFYGIGDKIPDRPHLDLHTVSRRLWGDRMPNCRLQTLEKHVLRFYRTDDLPSAVCPEAWQSYLTGDDFLMRGVLEHNRDDLLSLVGLAHASGRVVREPKTPRAVCRVADGLVALNRADASLALLRERFDDQDASTEPIGLALATQLKRARKFEDAAAVWHAVADAGSPDVTADLELAKHYEHRARDHARALEHALRALKRVDARGQAGVEHRVSRLRAKLGTGTSAAAGGDDAPRDAGAANPAGPIERAEGETISANLPLVRRRRTAED